MKTLGLKLDPVTERYGRIVSIPAAKRIEDFPASISDSNVRVNPFVADLPFFAVTATFLGTIAFCAFTNANKFYEALGPLGDKLLAAGKIVLAFRWQSIFGY
jgi:hypothetical protein